MPFALVSMSRSKSGAYSVRKAIPADVRDQYERLYRQRWEAKLTLPASMRPQEAKAKQAEFLATVETRIQAIRDENAGRTRSLSEREALALAGEWYRWYVDQHEDNPGSPERWENLNVGLEALLDRAVTEVDYGEYEIDPEEWRCYQQAVAQEGGADRFLANKGLALTPEAHGLFLDRAVEEFRHATELLQRRAKRDYSPDKRLEEFPEFTEAPKPHRHSGLTPWALFEAYIQAKAPAAATVNRWRAVFLDLEKHFVGRTVSSISEDEAQAWADGLLNSKRSAITVNDIWCSSARTVFGWAVKEARKLSSNPFKDAKVTQPRKVRTRETDEFSAKEVDCILKAALEFGDIPERAFDAARRWVPWLCAYTGARAGEITQLRGKDVLKQGGIWAIHITPEAGAVKTGKPRTVPLHEHLIDQGFLKFVEAKGDGPLFYNTASPLKATKVDPMNPRRPRSVKTRERLADWVRRLGVADKAIRPNHAWRHTFLRRAARAGIEQRIRRAFAGHSERTVADRYETPTVEDMVEALKRFPRHEVAARDKDQATPNLRGGKTLGVTVNQ